LRDYSAPNSDPSIAGTHSIYNASTGLDLDTSFAGIDFLSDPINLDASTFELLSPKDPLADLCLSYPASFDQFTDFLPPATAPLDPMAQVASAPSSLSTNDYSQQNFPLWIPGTSTSAPPLVKHSMETLLRVIRTWPKALAKGMQVPPMFHFSNMHPDSMLWPMVNCVAIAKMWVGQSHDATENVRQAVLQEMRSLFGQVSVIGRGLLCTKH
jgi:hypothetical protein